MKIGLDFDGVIADCGRLKSEAALELYGVNIAPEYFKKELILSQRLLTLEQYRELQEQIYGTRKLGLQLAPVPGVFEYIEVIEKQHEVRIITSRGKDETLIAQEWLAIQHPNFAIEFTSVGYGNSKAEALTGFDIFVDDDLDKIEPVVDIVPHRFLFSWGYNRHIAEGDIAQRVNSWADLYSQIKEIEGKSYPPHN